MYLNREMEAYIDSHQEDLKQLIRDLCAIPAPSHHEERRAEFCKKWFEQAGGQGVYIDEALNAVCPWGVTEDGPVVVLMAHTDTVFPDMKPMPFREDENKFYCPGVVDDTANLSVMMICARYFMQNRVPGKTGVLFVANSCEEGLGNLKGVRAICSAYGKRIRELVTFDGGSLNRVVNSAVGSHRYRVVVRTEGGHSFGNFGNRNAIRCLASVIDDLYAVKVPEKPDTKTTYNVGVISGGTSVNTIAQEAEMLYEYRSNDLDCLATMQCAFEAVIGKHRAAGLDVEVELVGNRPCAGKLDPQAYGSLIESCCQAVRDVLGEEPVYGVSSTDANIPLSMGIPAVCVSAVSGRGCHTRQEELDLDRLQDGCRLTMENIARYFAL